MDIFSFLLSFFLLLPFLNSFTALTVGRFCSSVLQSLHGICTDSFLQHPYCSFVFTHQNQVVILQQFQSIIIQRSAYFLMKKPENTNLVPSFNFWLFTSFKMSLKLSSSQKALASLSQKLNETHIKLIYLNLYLSSTIVKSCWCFMNVIFTRWGKHKIFASKIGATCSK